LYPTESRFLSSTVSSTSSFATFFMASTISVETERRCHLWINQQEAAATVGKDNSTLFLEPTWVNLENLTGLLQNLRSSVRRKHRKKKLQKYSCRHVQRKRRRRKPNTSVRRDLQVTFPREQTKLVRNLLRTASWTADPRVRFYATGTREHSLKNTCLIVFFTSTKKKLKNSRPLPRKKNNSTKETITKSIVVVYKRLKAQKRWDISPP
jgi:hypothetical protein